MRAEVFSGQLVYVDTEAGKIQILNRDNKQVTELNIDADTKRPGLNDWKVIMGDDIDAIVIDGKVKSISFIIEEE